MSIQPPMRQVLIAGERLDPGDYCLLSETTGCLRRLTCEDPEYKCWQAVTTACSYVGPERNLWTELQAARAADGRGRDDGS